MSQIYLDKMAYDDLSINDKTPIHKLGSEKNEKYTENSTFNLNQSMNHSAEQAVPVII